MATFGKARRAQGGGNAFSRPFAALFLVSLGLLLLRDTVAVRGAATFVTEVLVPAERVLGGVGSAVSRVWQAAAEEIHTQNRERSKVRGSAANEVVLASPEESATQVAT